MILSIKRHVPKATQLFWQMLPHLFEIQEKIEVGDSCGTDLLENEGVFLLKRRTEISQERSEGA